MDIRSLNYGDLVRINKPGSANDGKVGEVEDLYANSAIVDVDGVGYRTYKADELVPFDKPVFIQATPACDIAASPNELKIGAPVKINKMGSSLFGVNGYISNSHPDGRHLVHVRSEDDPAREGGFRWYATSDLIALPQEEIAPEVLELEEGGEPRFEGPGFLFDTAALRDRAKPTDSVSSPASPTGNSGPANDRVDRADRVAPSEDVVELSEDIVDVISAKLEENRDFLNGVWTALKKLFRG